jgi:hypothetical protein
MVGVGIDLFTELVSIVGPTILRGPRNVVNDAQKVNYSTLGYLLRGQPMGQVLRGGPTIRDYIYLQAFRRARTYKPNEPQTYANPQTGVMWSIPWRFAINEIVWNLEELELSGDGGDGPEGMFHAYKDLWDRKQQDYNTDDMGFWEELFWAVPDKTKMEAADGQEWYSIPAFINEHTNGLAPAAYPGGAWTTKMGLNPTDADKLNWVPQRFQYGTAAATGFDPTGADNVIVNLDEAIMACNFQPPPIAQQHFEASSMREPGCWVACSQWGRAKIMQLFRASNDRWQNVWDPFGNPTYAQIPFVHVAEKDTAAIYPTAAAGAPGTEKATANSLAGPRYEGIQSKYLVPVWHKNNFRRSLGVMTDLSQPTSRVNPYVSFGNLLARSLRRHFILYPGTNHPA